MDPHHLPSEDEVRAAYQQGRRGSRCADQSANRNYRHVGSRSAGIEEPVGEEQPQQQQATVERWVEEETNQARLTQAKGEEERRIAQARGHMLKSVAHPDRVLLHRVDQCQRCQGSLKQVERCGMEKRQVFDLPMVHLLASRTAAKASGISSSRA